MAQVIQKESGIHQEYRKNRRREILFGIPMVIAFVLWMLNIISKRASFEPGLIIPVFATFAIFGALAGHFKKKADILDAGIAGEEFTGSALSGLSDDYVVLSNVELNTERGRAELDSLVIGPNGVFVVETKNYRGALSGDCHDKSWSKYKMSPGGASDLRMVKNPIPQVKRQAWILNQYLRSHGIDQFVEGLVYFANCDLEYNVSGNDPHARVFFAAEDGLSELCEHIESSASRRLSASKIQQIVSLVSSPCDFAMVA